MEGKSSNQKSLDLMQKASGNNKRTNPKLGGVVDFWLRPCHFECDKWMCLFLPNKKRRGKHSFPGWFPSIPNRQGVFGERVKASDALVLRSPLPIRQTHVVSKQNIEAKQKQGPSGSEKPGQKLRLEADRNRSADRICAP